MFDDIMNFFVDIFLGWVVVEVVKILALKYIESHKNETRQIRRIKAEFYTGLIFAIFLIMLPEPVYQFLRIGKRILTILSLCLSLFGFLCMCEFKISDSKRDDSTDNDTEN